MPEREKDMPFSSSSTSSKRSARPFSVPKFQSYDRMDSFGGDGVRPGRPRKGFSPILAASYAFDWIILLAVGGIGLWLGLLTPNKRPFQLENHDIAFPFTEHETVPMLWAGIANTLAPVIIIAIIVLVFVPGPTVPPRTPKELIWRRKLWELHTGWLGLGLSVVGAWFVTNAMKNLFGKPRPDLLARCLPDIQNVAQYVVGGIANVSSNGQLVSPNICQSTDKAKLDDGFRSFPSGHASSSSAGLLYLSLFIASKFAITIPFLAPSTYADASSFSAFPSRMAPRHRARPAAAHPVSTHRDETYELVDRAQNGSRTPGVFSGEELSQPADPAAAVRIESHARTVAAVRLQAAAPPLYLLLLACLPTFGAVFIAGSRWFDFRHHAFDIIFGFLIGVITAVFAFRYYHLPISQGAGWAWGPRSHDKAWWAGVGSYSYATSSDAWLGRSGDEEEGFAASDAGSTAYRGAMAASTSNVNLSQQQQPLKRPGGSSSGGEAVPRGSPPGGSPPPHPARLDPNNRL